MVIDLDAAYASCEHAARSHYENFPVASLLVPAGMRRHVAALYAFARAADDFADEGVRTAAERQRLLDGWGARLEVAAAAPCAGPMPGIAPGAGEPANAGEIFLALGATIREKQLPVQLFRDLLSAFAQDVSVTRYPRWDDVLDYSRRSANPVGRLVLRIAGYDDPRLDGWSDDICSALQLTNFWQDLRIDFERGRIYLPGEEMASHGAEERDLATGRLTRAWRSAVAAAVARTRSLFLQGRPLCGAVRGRLRHELRATWLGGMRVLARIEHADFDVWALRPRLGAVDLPWLAWKLATWPSDLHAPIVR
jgi:hydroxysqualene synthase